MQVFQECTLKDDAGKSYELSLIGYKCIETYVKNKKNQNEVRLCHHHYTSISYYSHDDKINVFLLLATCRFAGYGRRFIPRMTGDSSISWTLFSTSLMVYWDMNVCSGQALSAQEELVCLLDYHFMQ